MANEPNAQGTGTQGYSWQDTDGDGYAETILVDRNGDGIAEQIQQDLDLDGVAESWETDTDGDGIRDTAQVDKNGDGLVDAQLVKDVASGYSVTDVDTDLDGTFDTRGIDADGDGYIEQWLLPDVTAPQDSTWVGSPTIEGGPFDVLVSNPAIYTDPYAWTTMNNIIDSYSHATGIWTLPDGWHYESDDWY